MPAETAQQSSLQSLEPRARAMKLQKVVNAWAHDWEIETPPPGADFTLEDLNFVKNAVARIQTSYLSQKAEGLDRSVAVGLFINEQSQNAIGRELAQVNKDTSIAEHDREVIVADLQAQLDRTREFHAQILKNNGLQPLPIPAHPGHAANSGGHVHPEQATASPQEGPEPPTTRLSQPGEEAKRLLKALHRLQADPDYVALVEGDGFNPVELGRVRAMLADYPTEQGAKIIEAEIYLEDIEDRLASVEGPNGDPEAVERLNREKTYWEAEKQRRIALQNEDPDSSEDPNEDPDSLEDPNAVWNQPTTRFEGSDQHSDAAGSSVFDAPTKHLSPAQLPGGHDAPTVRDLGATNEVPQVPQEPAFDPEIFEMLPLEERRKLVFRALRNAEDTYDQALLIASLSDDYRDLSDPFVTRSIPANVRYTLQTLSMQPDGYDNPSWDNGKIIALSHLMDGISRSDMEMMLYAVRVSVPSLIEDVLARERVHLWGVQFSNHLLHDRAQSVATEIDNYKSLSEAAQHLSPLLVDSYGEAELSEVMNVEAVLAKGGIWWDEVNSLSVRRESFSEATRAMMDTIANAVAQEYYPDLDLAMSDLHTFRDNQRIPEDTEVYLFELFSAEELTKKLAGMGITPEVLVKLYPLAEAEEIAAARTVSDLNVLLEEACAKIPSTVAADLNTILSEEIMSTDFSLDQFISRLIVLQQDNSLSPTQRVELQAIVYGYLQLFSERGFYDGRMIKEALDKATTQEPLQEQIQRITERNEGVVLSSDQWHTLFNFIEQLYEDQEVRQNESTSGVVSYVYHQLDEANFNDEALENFLEKHSYLMGAYLTRRTEIRPNAERPNGWML